MSKERRFLEPVIPTTTGRFNPLHIKHEEEVIKQLLLNSSINSQQSSDIKSPPFLIVMGSSGENRDLLKNPFSFEQRVEMIMIAISKLLRTDLNLLLSDDQKLLLAQDGIDRLINREAAFLRYADSPGVNVPPSLTPLADAIKHHCQQHKIPLESLASYVCIKRDEVSGRYEIGRHYQIYGNDSYKDMHQMTAVAQALGFGYHQDFVEEGGPAVSATQIRKNLQDNFHLLSPEVFYYLQNQLALAHLNQRAVGDSQGEDKPFGSQHLCGKLAANNQMLGLDGANAVIVDIKPELLSIFNEYRMVAKLPALDAKKSNNATIAK